MDKQGRWFALLHDNFDKLLLLALIGVFTAIHVFRGNVDATTMAWGRDQITLVIGTFLGLVGGPAVRGMLTKGNGHAPPPARPEAPPNPPLQSPPNPV